MLDVPVAVHRLVRVDQQVREHLRQLMLVGLDLRQAAGSLDRPPRSSPRRALVSAS